MNLAMTEDATNGAKQSEFFWLDAFKRNENAFYKCDSVSNDQCTSKVDEHPRRGWLRYSDRVTAPTDGLKAILTVIPPNGASAPGTIQYATEFRNAMMDQARIICQTKAKTSSTKAGNSSGNYGLNIFEITEDNF